MFSFKPSSSSFGRTKQSAAIDTSTLRRSAEQVLQVQTQQKIAAEHVRLKLSQKEDQVKELSDLSQNLAADKSKLLVKLKAEQESSERVLLSIDTTQSMCSRLGNELSNVMKSISATSSTYSSAHQRLCKYEQCIDVLKSKVLSLNEQNGFLDQSLKETQELLSKAHLDYGSIVHELEANVTHSDNICNQLRLRIEVLENDLADKTTALANNQKELADVAAKLNSIEHEKVTIETAMQELRSELEKLTQRFQSTEEQLSDALQRENSLQNQISNDSRDYENRLKDLSAQLEQITTQKLDAENQINHINESLNERSNQLSLVIEERTNLQAQVEELNSIILTRDNSINQLNLSLETAITENQENSKEILSKNELIQELQLSLSKLQNDLETSRNEMNGLSSNAERSVLELVAEKEALTCSITALKQELEDERLKVATSTEVIGTQRQSIDNAQMEVESLTTNLKSLQEEYDQLTEKSQKLVEKFRSQRTQLSNTEEQVSQLTKSLDSVNDEKKSLLEKLNESLALIESLTTERDDFKQKLDKITTENTELQSQNADLKKQVLERVDIRHFKSPTPSVATELTSPMIRKRLRNSQERSPELESEVPPIKKKRHESNDNFVVRTVETDLRTPKNIKDLPPKEKPSLSLAMSQFSQPKEKPSKPVKSITERTNSKRKSSKKNSKADDLFDDVFGFPS
ncbi:hypothetical protein RCL1_003650 [Eukaryota sp. TZLM3-RCL]